MCCDVLASSPVATTSFTQTSVPKAPVQLLLAALRMSVS